MGKITPITPVGGTRGLTLSQAARQVMAAQAAIKNPAILICDVSGSMSEHDAPGHRRRIDALRDVVLQLRRDYPQIRLLAFASRPAWVVALPEPGGGTALHLALDFARPAVKTESVVCLISDGLPDSTDAALEAARRFPARLNVFYVGPEGGLGQRFLQELAAASGGQFRTCRLDQSLLDQARQVLSLPAGRR